MKKKNAFTMIEILMIAIIMGTALLGVLSIMKKMEQSNIKIAENVIATNLAIQGYELTRAQADDIRYDNLLSNLGLTGANEAIESGNEAQRLQEGIYYVVYTKEKTGLQYSGNKIVDGLIDNNESNSGGYSQLRVILGAVCSGDNMKLSQTGICSDGSNTGELRFIGTGIQWSGICLSSSGWIPCTGGGQFFREIVVSEDVSPDGSRNYRYGYNVYSKVTYNWQAGGQARKQQIAEICAKIN